MGEFVYVLHPCGSLERILLRGWEFLPLPPQPPQVFSIRGLRLYFPVLEPWIVWSVLLPSCSSWFIFMQMWDCLVCLVRQATASPGLVCHLAAHPLCPGCQSQHLLPGWMSVSYFNFLVVGLPYSLIFWQLWLVLFLILNIF